jgi:hypothetical protein
MKKQHSSNSSVHIDEFLKRLYTPPKYATRLGISRQAVWQQIDAGKLDTIKISGRVFIVLGDKRRTG